MTDLEKRAGEYLKEKWGTSEMLILGGDARKVLVEFAQSETELLSKHILDLQKDKGNLTDRVRELEQQIEKMKCCPTCDNNKEEHTPEEHYRCKTCKKFCNWELAD